ncbi:conserved hypothetical protein [Arthrobacter sp. Hiyo8]|nr:conserved hypothetical protein [Arthrobacter sp. Hiyo8]
MTTVREAAWIKDARTVRLLSWFSLAWMVLEGALGLLAGGTAGSVSLIGWALSSAVEGLASIIVIWRFTGSRTLSESAEERAQKAVAISFWLLAPYIGIQSIIDLATGHRPRTASWASCSRRRAWSSCLSSASPSSASVPG